MILLLATALAAKDTETVPSADVDTSDEVTAGAPEASRRHNVFRTYPKRELMVHGLDEAAARHPGGCAPQTPARSAAGAESSPMT